MSRADEPNSPPHPAVDDQDSAPGPSSNPFQSPAPDEASVAHTDANWRAIAVRWEWLRIPYNLLVGLAGILGLALFGWRDDVLIAGVGSVVWGIGANLCFLWGPIVQMYLCWFAEPKGEPTDRQRPIALPLAAAPITTYVMFALGLIFSILLTLAATIANGVFWPNQM